MKKLRLLWLGELPLGEAFWTWAIGLGLAVNLATTGLRFAFLASEQHWAVVFLSYALPLPYYFVAAVGVWRSADRHQGLKLHAELARAFVVWVMLIFAVI